MSTNTIDPEDPRLTAYVLGELKGREREEFEALLARDATAQAEVAALRAATRMITDELARESAPELKPDQRAKLVRRVRTPKPVEQVPSGWGLPSWLGGLSLAGVLAIVLLVPVTAVFMGSAKYTEFHGSSERASGRVFYKSVSYDPAPRPPPQQGDSFRLVGAPRPSADAPNSRDAFNRTVENDFFTAAADPLSTFSINVDTASYALMRRFLEHSTRPPVDSVRVEELINYFPYQYPEPDQGEPLTVLAETTACPWTPDHRLVRIGLKGRSLKTGRPASNLVFLLDVSGSMDPEDRLPLCVKSLKMLTRELGESDTISIVVYAGASGMVLPPTSGNNKAAILAALDNLHAGGATNGGEGIELAYQTAVSNFIKGGNNRVILATDGDFNLGVTSRGDLERLIEAKRKTGVFLSILGFGIGNHQDATLERLSTLGNGNHAYIDSEREAHKVLVEQMGGTLVTVAKDVKVQVEFNPAQVSSYRLIGYEHRLLAAQDFNDDTKDAGELGAGHTVTALYEIAPATRAATPAVDPLKYQTVAPTSSPELLTVKVRHQKPEGSASTLLSFPVTDRGTRFEAASEDTRWAAAVAEFGMILRDSRLKGTATLDTALTIATAAVGKDPGGYRAEFLSLIAAAKQVVR